MEIYQPVQWQHNYQVDRTTLLLLFQDLDNEQREKFAAELTSLAELLQKMSGETDE